MSQYLHVIARSKKDNDITLCLAWWSTSVARNEDIYEAFPYSESNVIITPEDFVRRVKVVEDALQEKRDYLDKLNSQKQELIALAQGCKETAAAKEAFDHLYDIEQSITEMRNDYDQWQNIVNTLNIVSDIYEDNKDRWELYYSNC